MSNSTAWVCVQLPTLECTCQTQWHQRLEEIMDRFTQSDFNSADTIAQYENIFTVFRLDELFQTHTRELDCGSSQKIHDLQDVVTFTVRPATMDRPTRQKAEGSKTRENGSTELVTGGNPFSNTVNGPFVKSPRMSMGGRQGAWAISSTHAVLSERCARMITADMLQLWAHTKPPRHGSEAAIILYYYLTKLHFT